MNGSESPQRMIVWHDVENGAYSADLPLWRELAREASEREREREPTGETPEASEILELGCGTGRVALDLARAGHRVLGVDVEPVFTAELDRRAAERGLAARALRGDITTDPLPRPAGGAAGFGLVIGAMQVVQLLPGPEARARTLSAIRAALGANGMAALAIVEGERMQGAAASPDGDPDGEHHERNGGDATDGNVGTVGNDGNETSEGCEVERPPLPDVLERDGWVYSSLPIAPRVRNGEIHVRRLRHLVSPAGELSEDVDLLRLAVLTAEQLEDEARAAGLEPAGRREVPATDDHVGSTVVLLRHGPGGMPTGRPTGGSTR